jgi:hypothetical protein
VQVGDAAVGVDHREVGPGLIGLLDRRPGLVVGGLEDRGEAVVGVREPVAEAGEDVLEVGADGVPEDDRVGHLHHRRLQVHGEEEAMLAGVGHLALEERVERLAAHDRGVDDLARQHRHALLEHGDRPVGGDVLDPQVALALD